MIRAATVVTPQGGARPATAASPDARRGRALRERTGWRSRVPLLFAFGLYLALALAIWSRLLAHAFGAALPAGSADPGQEVWFLAWVPHALGAGTNPFFSHAVFFPSGVNLLANTSMELLGLLFAPVTVTAGPVAAFDVAVLAAPALSALGAFALCRRFVTWWPAAFAGGLFYGFGPFVAGDLRYGHLDLTWLVFPPLILCCLDALVVRGTRRPLAAGAALGILVVAQFFVSTELLAITALTAAAAAVVVASCWPRAVAAHLAAAWRGLALATVIVVGALAYPFWVVVAGPHHVAGPVWRHIGTIATSLAATVEPRGQLAGVSFVSGSNGSYLGVAMLAVLLAGAAVLWRSPVLRVALAIAAMSYVASLGYEVHVGHGALHVPLPAAALGHVPLLDSIVPERFASMVDLFCGLALAVVVDHVRAWDRKRPMSRRPAPLAPGDAATVSTTTVSTTTVSTMTGATRTGATRTPGPRAAAVPLLGGLAVSVAAFALVPVVVVPRWPYAVTSARTATLPAVDRASADSHRSGSAPVVAVYPDTSNSVSEQMVRQASDGFSFTLPDGYAIVPGRNRRAVESPPIDALWLVFAAAGVHRLRLPLTATTRAAVRADLRTLGVDEVVVLPGMAGSARVRRALRETLGAPVPAAGGTARWSLHAAR
ncbi:MAG TPA: hypothetical protein VND62_05405 [Acidimicrobiales bacterium]|nr:hypothetical protein [Acidimicrobiales bacterium]